MNYEKSDVIETVIIIIGILMVILLPIYFIYNKNSEIKTNKYDNLNYASINDPYVYPVIYEKIISEDDANYMIKKSESLFTPSTILSGEDTNIRKSQTYWLSKHDEVGKKIVQKVCEIVYMPFENAEDIQIVKYEPGGFYKEHHDACCDKTDDCVDFCKDSGQRMATMVIYLNDNFEGGSTKFQNLNKEYKPTKTSGILFRPLATNTNKCHPLALHSGTPVISGIKYIANVWIREKKF